MVEVRLLGQIGMLRDSQEVPLKRSHCRAVLAMLGLTPGTSVSADALIDRIWGEHPPNAAMHSLHTHVSVVRRALAQATGGDGAALLRRVGDGYVLDIDAEQVDLHRSRRRALDARQCAGKSFEGDLQAAQLLRAACAMWLDTPLAGLKGDWATRMRSGLTQERLAMAVDRFHVELRIGEHAAAASELAALLADFPLEEPLVELQMLALYRSGRQADALNLYRQTRRSLVEALGEEPGPALRRLHERILQRDPELTLSAGGGHEVRSGGTAPSQMASDGVDTWVPPAQLPPDVATFAGRQEHLRTLDATLPGVGGDGSFTAVAAISGTAGVGKTALAVHWAHRMRSRFPDGQLYVNLRGFGPSGAPMDPAAALRGFLEALGVAPHRMPSNLEGQTGLYRSLLSNRRVLVVLDNARDAEQVRPLLPAAAGCVVLVTSRDKLSGLVATEGARPMLLDLLPDSEATQLLDSITGPGCAAKEPEAVRDIVSRCAGLPLALSIVGARAATSPGVPLATLAAELADAHVGLDVFDGGDPASNVRAVISWSYRTLGEGAARLFRLLALHPGPDVSLAASASVAALPAATITSPMRQLTDSHLVLERPSGRYVLHDLLRAYASELASDHMPDAARQAAQHRLLDHYLHTAHAAAKLVAPTRRPLALPPVHPGAVITQLHDPAQAHEWFAAERAVLLGLVEHAAAAGFDTHAWQLAWTMVTTLDRQARWRDLASIHLTALRAAGRANDHNGLANAHRGLARAYLRLGRVDEACAHLNESYEHFGEHGDRTGQAETLRNLAEALGSQGHYQQAMEKTTLALALYPPDHRAGRAGALNALGWYHAVLGQHRRALEYCHRALALHQQVGDRVGQASTWHSLGYIHHRLGKHRHAESSYSRAFAIYLEQEDLYHAAISAVDLGDVHRIDRPEQARAIWQRALALEALTSADADRVRTRLRQLDRAVPPATCAGMPQSGTCTEIFPTC